jgi:hypothetical protein
MIDIEIMGWRGWFLWTLTLLGISSEKLAIGTALRGLQLFRRSATTTASMTMRRGRVAARPNLLGLGTLLQCKERHNVIVVVSSYDIFFKNHIQ